MRSWFLLSIVGGVVLGTGVARSESFDDVVSYTHETAILEGSGDVADDPAVLLHRAASRSVILGTSKADSGKGGLYAFDLSGEIVARTKSRHSFNNVDVAYGLKLNGRASHHLIAVTDRTADGLVLYQFNWKKKRFRTVGRIDVAPDVYGVTLGRVDGHHYAYVSTKDGIVRQYKLDGTSGQVAGKLVRSFDVGTTVEGMVVDEVSGQLYVGEEQVGIWRYAASATSETARSIIDRTGGSGHLTADVEGLAIYEAGKGRRFLVASSQGSNDFQVYNLATGGHLGEISITGVEETDGIELTNADLGGAYNKGMFITHDAKNTGTSNFKMTSWTAIAKATGLPVRSP